MYSHTEGILASPDTPQAKQRLIRDRVVTLLVDYEGPGGVKATIIPYKITLCSAAAKIWPAASISPKGSIPGAVVYHCVYPPWRF